jgi:hypothetical protein
METKQIRADQEANSRPAKRRTKHTSYGRPKRSRFYGRARPNGREYNLGGRLAYIERSGSQWIGWFADDHDSQWTGGTIQAVLDEMQASSTATGR